MKILAHRGAETYAPENTSAAFEKALLLPVDGIETDIHMTKDGLLVLLHDDSLERTTNGTGIIWDKTWDEIKDLDAGSWFDPKFSSERIPLVSDVLNKLGGRIHFDLEIKQSGIEEKLVALVKKHGLEKSVGFTSFMFSSVAKMKLLNPKLTVGFLSNDVSDDTIKKVLEAKLDQLCPNIEHVTPALMTKLHSLGLFVRAWGVKSEKLIKYAIETKVDGMTVADPLVYQAILNSTKI